jgi:hypothetical protein
MSVIHRLSLAAAGLVCLAALASPALAQGRNERPNADTPRLLIATFRTAGTDARAGVEGAEALRARVQREFSARELVVIPRDRMNDFLIQSGYPADSTLGLEELKLLAQNFRADAIVDGVVSKTATGVAARVSSSHSTLAWFSRFPSSRRPRSRMPRKSSSGISLKRSAHCSTSASARTRSRRKNTVKPSQQRCRASRTTRPRR